MNEIILAPCDAGYVQSCTGFYLILYMYCPQNNYALLPLQKKRQENVMIKNNW
jgi:hypothetical protein